MTEPLPFGLLSAAGNRILIVDASHLAAPRNAAAARIAARGARRDFDQLLLLFRTGEDWQVEIRNRDGSPAEQCGNGMRCLAAWIERRHGLPPGGRTVRTAAGTTRLDKAGQDRFHAELPAPIFGPEATGYGGPGRLAPGDPPAPGRTIGALDVVPPQGFIPLDGLDLEPAMRALFRDRGVFFDLVSLGNPHAIIWLPKAPKVDLEAIDLAALAEGVAREFERGVNLSLALTPEANARSIDARVWERGVGETPACGSAAGAIAAAAWIRRRIGDRIEIRFPGGSLEVFWRGPGHPIRLGGPVEWIEEGVFPDE
jgi:diaminopimelate epimerase